MEAFWCSEPCGVVDLEDIGGGKWKCPTCGNVYVFEEDDDNGEALSVWDAANIYLSRGCDEDYRFGYTHKELMKALGK